jgi:hypothetical protein
LKQLDAAYELLFLENIRFKFLEIPSGAGCATESRKREDIYAKKSVVQIVNEDNNCFWYALAVILNQDHEKYDYIRRGRPIRTKLAK